MLGVSVSCIILVFWSICRLRCFARPVDLSVQPRSITYTSRLNSSILIFDELCEFGICSSMLSTQCCIVFSYDYISHEYLYLFILMDESLIYAHHNAN